jgi:cytochrome c-type biogenesis protein CcmE
MKLKKRQRLSVILIVVTALSLAAGLSLYALKDNVAFFFTPDQIGELRQTNPALVAAGRVFRLGGLVKKGSVEKRARDLSIRFIVTDGADDVTVEYKGLLPDLFREGQGVVAKGAFDNRPVFIASELLAKHDENYMPPELKKALPRDGKAAE